MERLSSEEIQQLSNKTVEQICKLFVDTIFKDVKNNNSNFWAIEYKDALYSLMYDEINNNRQNTKIFEIEEIDKIRPLLKNEKICKLNRENITFRHDRLKRFLQVQSLLNQEQVSNDVLSNPYYNEILGEYIAYANFSSAILNISLEIFLICLNSLIINSNLEIFLLISSESSLFETFIKYVFSLFSYVFIN